MNEFIFAQGTAEHHYKHDFMIIQQKTDFTHVTINLLKNDSNILIILHI